MAKLGVRREVEAAVVCEKYRKFAPRFVHTNALSHTFPKFYQKKTLTIAVENPAWAQQVMTQKVNLIKAINDSLGKEQVENLKTIVAEHIS